MDLSVDFASGLSAQVDLEYQDDGGGGEFDEEQPFFIYDVNEALSFKTLDNPTPGMSMPTAHPVDYGSSIGVFLWSVLL